jgi:hypothetical protein
MPADLPHGAFTLNAMVAYGGYGSSSLRAISTAAGEEL